jgi:hypothetical protein
MSSARVTRLTFTGPVVVAIAILSAVPALAGGSGWKVGSYTPSGQSLSMSSAAEGAGIAAFNFTDQPDTALLATSRGSSKGALLGDLTGKTVSATFTISGATGAFTYWGEGTADNPCVNPANTRLYFTTDNGGGFAYTHYWWSNPNSAYLANGTFTVTASVVPAQWSDWNGKGGLEEQAGFADAASNVTLIGLSFGGGCFFENGVGTTDGSGTFTLDSFTVTGT